MYLLYFALIKATSNTFLDPHPNFVKNGGGWRLVFYIFFFFPTALNNRTVLKKIIPGINIVKMNI